MPKSANASESGIHSKHPAKRTRIWLKRVSLLVAAGLIFTLGVNVGNGRIAVMGQGGSNQSLPNRLEYSSVDALYKSLKNNYDGTLDSNKLVDGAKQGLVKAAGDPYTEYMNAAEYKAFNSELSGSFTGIGAELSQDSQGNIVVVAPIAGFPADKAGLKPKDMIAQINGQSTSGMTVSQAVDKIRGPKGSSVKLGVVRSGKAQDITITRDDINVPSVTSKVENGIGYLTISRFGDDTAGLASKAAQSFKDQNVKGVVLDLRSDPGGLLDAAVSVSSLWLPQGKTILTERRDNVITNTYTAQGGNVLNGIPTAVLIDEGSASASEITAGALKDNGVATLVGQKSYGKGSVQQLINLGNGGVLKVTVARWYTPNGININKNGITPDKVVSISADDVKAGNDPQKAAATQVLGVN